jgi:DNA-directed RNA polymerase specialized sigma24 family protein
MAGMSASDANPGADQGSRFRTTRWSVVLSARVRAEPGSEQALAALCATYWYPLYAYIRRQGHNADEAQDLTQEFFARLLEKDFLTGVQREKGKFRAFLLAACNHFLANERDRVRAKKRGGGRQPLSFDADAEKRYLLEPADALTPEALFQRRWALTFLEQVLSRLRADFEGRGKGPVFDRLRGFLVGQNDNDAYQKAALDLDMTETAIKVTVHRMRQKYRDFLREEIARTVDADEHIDEEIRDLFAALGAGRR